MNGEISILDIRGIRVSYADLEVLNGFSMQLRRGEMVCGTGASGSGKSSLLRAILGFVPLSAGNVFVDGIEVRSGGFSTLRHRVAYLPQDLFFPCEWVEEILKLPFSIKCNKGRKVTKEMWSAAFKRLGLDDDIMEKRMNEISGGQRQRVMLAVVDMLDKDIVLLDEPTSALDADSAKRVVEFIKYMSARGKGVIVVTHDSTLMTMCDRKVEISLI